MPFQALGPVQANDGRRKPPLTLPQPHVVCHLGSESAHNLIQKIYFSLLSALCSLPPAIYLLRLSTHSLITFPLPPSPPPPLPSFLPSFLPPPLPPSRVRAERERRDRIRRQEEEAQRQAARELEVRCLCLFSLVFSRALRPYPAARGGGSAAGCARACTRALSPSPSLPLSLPLASRRLPPFAPERYTL